MSQRNTIQKQYASLKEECPDSILLFRVGDFYEAFFADAEVCAKTLGLTLTTRRQGDERMPMAGFPCHSLEAYLQKLVAAGHKGDRGSREGKEVRMSDNRSARFGDSGHAAVQCMSVYCRRCGAKFDARKQDRIPVHSYADGSDHVVCPECGKEVRVRGVRYDRKGGMYE